MASVAEVETPSRGLPAIPLIEAGDGPVSLLEAEASRARDLIAAGQRAYGAAALQVADHLSRRWLARAANPYLDEIEAVAARLGGPGAHMLNLSYEWCCTCGVAADPEGAGSRLLRSLDWPLAGLGRNLVVARQSAPAGDYFNVTWPGFVGVTTALAPGRFAAALNQAPMRRFGLPSPADWLINRVGVWRRPALPPSHLLRRVMDECRSYAEARARLTETPICLPALYILSGAGHDEGCVIERLEDRAVVHEAPVSVANHWLSDGLGGDERGAESRTRHALMEAAVRTVQSGFDWLVPPVLNACTRVAVVANAATGRLLVRGWETQGPATEILRL